MRVLFICGTHNQTTQLHAIATKLSDCQNFFTPFYAEGLPELAGRIGLLESTILGDRMRAGCLAYLRDHGLTVDMRGATYAGHYDLVVTCTDLLIPHNVDRTKLVVVQEGMLDTETLWSRCVDALHLPPYLCGTTLTGTRGRYARLCVASEGFRELFSARGAPAAKLRVTGVPNFDDCRAFQHNRLPERGYVLACTSDLRETWRSDDRPRFIRRVLDIAAGRPVHFKFHPNENQQRARREVLALCPSARIHSHERTEELIANCTALVTQVSSVTFVGLALDKEVHSDLDLTVLRRLLPLQNGGTSAQNIAQVCRELSPESALVQQAPDTAHKSHGSNGAGHIQPYSRSNKAPA
ncbi:MAG: hypothetical protein RL701_4910 [Pseudomonadota bacterium]